MRLAIVGPSVNTDNIPNLEQKMIDLVVKRYQSATLVSGGSALIDHVAVLLFLHHRQQFPHLKLYLPAKINVNTGYFDKETLDGRILNDNHIDKTRKELVECIKAGAEVIICEGFIMRNIGISSQCDVLLAASFHRNKPLPLTGTAFIWDLATNIEKKYINLHNI